MKVSHNFQENAIENTNDSNAFSAQHSRTIEFKFQKLIEYLDNIKKNKNALTAEEHEQTIVRLTHELGRSALSELMECYDLHAEKIQIGEKIYRHKHEASQTYQTAFGSVKVSRHVYVNRKKDGDGKSVCPLELQMGIIGGYWTPLAAKNASWALAHLTPQEVEELLLQFGKMDPSRSSLDRLPKMLLKNWEIKEIERYKNLIEHEEIPKNAATVAVSLDGVMLAMKGEKTKEKTDKNRKYEWREASCGTLSFFDSEGERLSTIQYGRMPEHKKKTLKILLKENLESILKRKPNLNIVYVADGAQDNWCFFEEEMAIGFEVTDFYHACEYLKKAFSAGYGSDFQKGNEKFHTYKGILRDEEDGVERVLRALRYLRQKKKNNKEIDSAVTYFTNNQHRMKYAKAKKENYPIGSGVVEAACKSLVGQRMKRSGMSWHFHGGQSILTLRALVKSQRFEKAWECLVKPYKKSVKPCSNVVKLFG